MRSRFSGETMIHGGLGRGQQTEGRSHLLPQPQHHLFTEAKRAASKDVWDSKEHLVKDRVALAVLWVGSLGGVQWHSQ